MRIAERLHHARTALARRGGAHAAARNALLYLLYLRAKGVSAFLNRLRALPREERAAQLVSIPETVAPHEALPGVLILGPLHRLSGRGEDVRTAAHALAACGIPFHLCEPFGEDPEARTKMAGFPFFSLLSGPIRHRATLLVLNADEVALARQALGDRPFTEDYRIIQPAWELSRFPEAWLPQLAVADEVWAPSRFIQQAIGERLSCPVVRMPLAVEPETVNLPRGRFGLPDDRFLFLFTFDFSSYVARKNPAAVIEAFHRAFPDPERSRVGLVVKLNGSAQRPDDARAFHERDDIRRPWVHVIDRVLDGREICGLVRGCDAFVSLHRSEGFGRGPAEAMYHGKPVIVTGYSGNLDYSNELTACVVDHTLIPVGEHEYPHGASQVWAEPDLDHAARFMRRLVEDRAFAARIGRTAAAYIREHHSHAAVGIRMAERLRRLGLL